MKEEENILELNNMDPDPPFIVTSENTDQKALGSKIAPPVAPRPAWFRPSLKKILDNKDQRKQANYSEDIPTAGVNKRDRSTTGAVNMSIKQKIHSFEMFSSSEGQIKKANWRSTHLSNSLALIENDSASPCLSYPASDDGKSKQDFPQVIQSDRSTPVVNENISVTPCGITSATYKDFYQTKAKSSEDHHSCSEISINNPPSDTISTQNDSVKNYANLACVHTDNKFEPSKQESELEKVDISRSTEISALLSASSERINQNEAVNNSDENSRNDSGELLRTAQIASSITESQPQKSQEGENFGKIIAFSNQVSQAIMRSFPTSNDDKPQSRNIPDPPLKVADNPQVSEMHIVCTNKAFSVSLATLRECTIEQGRGGFDRTSRIYSIISVMPSQEIQKMIEEIKALDEETLKQLEDIHVVILHKDVGAGLGFSIAGGCDLENKAPTVHKVFPCGLAAQEGTIQKGDEVLSINGLTLLGVKHMDATAVLRQARNQKLAAVVICKRADEEGKDRVNRRGENANIPREQEAVLSVDLEKGDGGIGFSLEGGRGSIHGDRPLVINRIFKGGAAEQSGLQCGDELLQVLGVSLHDMTRFEAWNMIKALPEGYVTLVIRRGQVAKE